MYLFDSLYRGLADWANAVWKAKRAVTAKHFHKRKLRTGALLDNFYGYLLDGQQRLTALSRVRDNDDDYRPHVLHHGRTVTKMDTISSRGKAAGTRMMSGTFP